MTSRRYSREAVILDSNLLLLLIVGTWNPRAIASQKRLSDLNYADFLLLTDYLHLYRRIVTTAHILTEVSNLAGAAFGPTKDAIFLQLSQTVEVLSEQQVRASSIVKQPEFLPFGMTDAAISFLCADLPLLTQDGRLARHLQLRGFAVLTLDQLRAMRNEGNRI